MLGFLFESLVTRDLRVYAQAADAEVLAYRDQDLEIDAAVRATTGSWAAFEVKLGRARVDAGAASLLRFAKRVDTSSSGEPSCLAVITATGYGYR